MARLFPMLFIAFASPLLAADYEFVPVFQNGTGGYNAYRIPAIVQAANGDLLAFCEAREGGDASKIDLVMKRSTDEGKSWSQLQVVQAADDFKSLFGENPPPITAGNPAPVVDHLDPEHAGRIWLPFTLENDKVFVVYSDDNGATWSPRRDITSSVKREGWGWYATGPVHSIQLQRGEHKGRLVVPCDHRLGSGGADRGPCGGHCIYSDDHGLTWKIGGVDGAYEDDLEPNETTVVELNDGRLCFNARDQNGKAPGTRAVVYSNDGGATFEHQTEGPFPIYQPLEGVIDPPVVQCSLQRMASTLDGAKSNLILFSGPDDNGPTGKGRSDLRLRYSTDETQAWHDGPLIHTGPAAYSDMVRLSGEVVGILFEAGKTGTKSYNEIWFVRVEVGSLGVE
ncbi:MAG: exo-alpha-sialidase [Planctomycetaceae bacterium]|nr:exo-alpha-sialidase [Planctomycetaceae bacterium]